MNTNVTMHLHWTTKYNWSGRRSGWSNVPSNASRCIFRMQSLHRYRRLLLVLTLITGPLFVRTFALSWDNAKMLTWRFLEMNHLDWNSTHPTALGRLSSASSHRNFGRFKSGRLQVVLFHLADREYSITSLLATILTHVYIRAYKSFFIITHPHKETKGNLRSSLYFFPNTIRVVLCLPLFRWLNGKLCSKCAMYMKSHYLPNSS